MKAVKLAAAVVWLALLGAALIVVSGHTLALAERSAKLTDTPPLAKLDTRLIDVVTLGHRGLWDDVAAIWLLQILADPKAASEGADQIASAVLAVTRHNIKIESIYLMSCFVLGLEMNRPELCERILLDGLKAFPQSWKIPVTQGFIYAFRLNDQKQAAMYYGLAASRPNSPVFLKRLAQHFVEREKLDVGEMQETLDGLLGDQDGSKLGSFLRERRQSAPPERQESPRDPATRPAP